jgi:hypothetical protein
MKALVDVVTTSSAATDRSGLIGGENLALFEWCPVKNGLQQQSHTSGQEKHLWNSKGTKGLQEDTG